MNRKIYKKWTIILPIFIILISNYIVGSSIIMQTQYIQKTPKKDEIIQYFIDNKDKLKYNKSEIIVKLNNNDPEHINKLEKNYNIKVIRNSKSLTIISYDINQYSIEELLTIFSKDNNVIFAEPNYILDNLSSPSTEPYYNIQWAYTNTNYGINVTSTWAKTYGSSNVVVGVVDTGINYNHTDLSNNIWHNLDEIANNGIDDDLNGYIDDNIGWDFVKNINDPIDINGHGTHVAGIIAAGVNDIGVVGVAPNVKVMALKVADAAGDIYITSVVDAIDYAEANGVKVFNFSFGGTTYSGTLDYAIQASNSLFIAAAGNEATNNDITPFYPASYSYDNIISVAAISSNGRLASFSNYGATSVDIAAPGDTIYSTDVSGYSYKSGTSMAAPYVVGQAAILYSYNNNLTYLEVKNAILNNKKTVSYLNGKVATNGIINVNASYLSISPFDGGDGTELKPYLISTNTQLNLIRNNLTASYKLTANLDLTYDTQNPSGLFYNEGQGWLPIGDTNISTTSTFMGSEFTGNFDGNGYTIKGLKIQRSNEYYVGLFAKMKGNLSKSLSLKNLNITDSSIIAYGYSGGISGYSEYVDVSNVSVTGSNNLAQYKSGGYIGGLFGYLENSNISKAITSVNISANSNFAGGMVGKMIDSNITKSFNEGNVAPYNYGGGIAGYAKGNITDVFNIGSVEEYYDYANLAVGGIVGTLESGNIANTYYIGNLKQTNISPNIDENLQLIVGSVTSGTVQNSYYYNPYNFINNDYGTELSIEQLYTSSNYIGFDFSNIWQIDVNSKLPTLKNMNFDLLTDFTLSHSNLYFNLSSSSPISISASNSPQTIRRLAYVYSSSNTNVVKVDGFGEVIATGVGEAVLYVYSIELGISKEMPVLVEKLPTSISIQEGNLIDLKLDGLDSEKIIQLTYAINPSDTTGVITWTSSDASIASVDSSGLVTAIGEGTATIRLTITNGTKFVYAEIIVNVNKETLYGDVNNDNIVSITDLVKLRRYLAGLDQLDIKGQKAADINKDGQIRLTDLVKLRRYLAGLEEI